MCPKQRRRCTAVGVRDRFVRKTAQVAQQLDQLSGGALSIIWRSLVHFGDARSAEAAASLAYYGLFALFPLALFLIAILSYVMESDAAFQQALQFMRILFPFSGDIITRNLAGNTAAQAPVTLLGLAGLLWSALGFFNVLAVNVNRAWPSVKLRGIVQSRLISVAMILVLFILMLLSLVSTTLITLMPMLLIRLRIQTGEDFIVWRLLLQVAPPLFTYLMFVALYRWVPNKTVHWKAVLIGALFTAASWELSKRLFAFYLGMGIDRFQFIYGSLAALIALMVWTYLGNLITLLGAHLVSSIDQAADQKALAAGAVVGPAAPAREEKKEPERQATKSVHG